MKRNLYFTIVAALTLSVAWPAQARDDKHVLPIAAALEAKEAKDKLDGSIKFFFGRENPPKVLKVLRSESIWGKAHTSSGTTEKVCNAAFLWTVAQFHRRAKQLGADAVVNMVSSFKKHPELSSSALFECFQGSRTTSVVIRGDIVKIGE